MMLWTLELGWPESWEIGQGEHCKRRSSGVGWKLKSQFADFSPDARTTLVLNTVDIHRDIIQPVHLDQTFVKLQLFSQCKHSLTSERWNWNWWPLQPHKCNSPKEYLKIKKEWKNKHLYLTISQHLALPSSSPKGQESYPLFPLKYTLSQFLHQMGTLFNYWGFFAMIIIGTAKMSTKETCCFLSLYL